MTDSHGNIEPADDHDRGHGGELVPDEPIANPYMYLDEEK